MPKHTTLIPLFTLLFLAWAIFFAWQNVPSSMLTGVVEFQPACNVYEDGPFIAMKNISDDPLSMGGWTLHTGNGQTTLPPLNLPPDAILQIWSGSKEAYAGQSTPVTFDQFTGNTLYPRYHVYAGRNQTEWSLETSEFRLIAANGRRVALFEGEAEGRMIIFSVVTCDIAF